MNSIALYVHIPFCIKKCLYCDFPSFSGCNHLLSEYLPALRNELAYQSKHYTDCSIKTIFVGGGTPSLLEPEHYLYIATAIQDYFPIEKNAEISIEVNPGTLTEKKASAMKIAGFNRISIGIQTIQDRLLKELGRIHSVDDIYTSLNIVTDSGFSNINLDLMFGLPNQTVEMWKETLEFAATSPATHCSCYSLMIEENTPYHSMVDKKQIQPSSDELDREMYHVAIKFLDKHHFEQYELSNFAKKGYFCKHNLVYWKRGDYLGIGLGAHSLMYDQRFYNPSDFKQYFHTVAEGHTESSAIEWISNEAALSEALFMGLRLNEGVNIDRLSKKYSISVEQKYHDELIDLLKKELIERHDDRITLTGKGLDLANYVFSAFV